jgi:hypothetical protein
MTSRLLFSDGDIKTEMVPPLWNNFLRSLLRFIMIRSGHDEGLGRISFRSIFFILWWQKEEEERHQKEVSQLRLHECWPLFVRHMFSGLLPSVCLCCHPYYKASYRLVLRSGGYNLDENQFLNICVIQSACNVLMCPAII